MACWSGSTFLTLGVTHGTDLDILGFYPEHLRNKYEKFYEEFHNVHPKGYDFIILNDSDDPNKNI